MKIVIDTNLIFSTLIIRHQHREAALFRMGHQFFTPNFAFREIYEKKERILRYTRRPVQEFYVIFEQLIQTIQFVRDAAVSRESKYVAYRLCVGVDEKDVPFVALALELDAKLWTGDKKLKTHLLTEGYDNFFQI
jgi:predicted nucleic acid-binding protein